MTEKQLEIKRIFEIKDLQERTKAIHEYMKKNVTPSIQCKANVYEDATVIFNGRLL